MNVLLTGLVVSHENSKPWELYDTLTVSSDVDGALTRLGSRHIAASSNKEGSVHIFGKANATDTTHNMTAVVQEDDFGVTEFTSVAANSVLLRGAAGFGTVVSTGSSSGGNTPSLTIASTVGDMVFAVFGSATDLSGTFTGGTIRYSAGSTVDGNGDFTLIATQPGATSVTMSAVGLTLYGAVAINIPRAT